MLTQLTPHSAAAKQFHQILQPKQPLALLFHTAKGQKRFSLGSTTEGGGGAVAVALQRSMLLELLYPDAGLYKYKNAVMQF